MIPFGLTAIQQFIRNVKSTRVIYSHSLSQCRWKLPRYLSLGKRSQVQSKVYTKWKQCFQLILETKEKVEVTPKPAYLIILPSSSNSATTMGDDWEAITPSSLHHQLVIFLRSFPDVKTMSRPRSSLHVFSPCWLICGYRLLLMSRVLAFFETKRRAPLPRDHCSTDGTTRMRNTRGMLMMMMRNQAASRSSD